jgi:hypothetical protein
MHDFRKRSVKCAGMCLFFMLIAGCNYPEAVAQNLGWGLPGLISGGFTGFAEWITGALVNAAAFGVQ